MRGFFLFSSWNSRMTKLKIIPFKSYCSYKDLQNLSFSNDAFIHFWLVFLFNLILLLFITTFMLLYNLYMKCTKLNEQHNNKDSADYNLNKANTKQKRTSIYLYITQYYVYHFYCIFIFSHVYQSSDWPHYLRLIISIQNLHIYITRLQWLHPEVFIG